MTRGTMKRTLCFAVLVLGAQTALLAGVAPFGQGEALRVARAVSNRGDLAVTSVREGLASWHVRFQQLAGEIPVLEGTFSVHMDRGGTVFAVHDATKAVPPATAPRIDAARAIVAGARAFSGAAEGASLAYAGRSLVWLVVGSTPRGSAEALVDARTGVVRSVRSLVRRATGRVFDPNPVVTLGGVPAGGDNRDRETAAISSAYRTVPMLNLDGSGYLRGAWADASVSKKPAFSNGDFIYPRSDPRFEQVMAYVHVDRAQTYIQSLGFTGIDAEPQKLKANGTAQDNSFFDTRTKVIMLGSGGVDDGEDADVILHEYGHAIQDAQVPGFGIGAEAGAIGEGFGDYWAVTATLSETPADRPCVADWDAISYSSTGCLRRVDSDLTVADQTGQVHHDGNIWSRALWDIAGSIGHTTADIVILESQFAYAPNTTFADAAGAVLDADLNVFGGAHEGQLRAAFEDRGIL